MATLRPENTYGRADGTRTLRMIRGLDMPRVHQADHLGRPP